MGEIKKLFPGLVTQDELEQLDKKETEERKSECEEYLNDILEMVKEGRVDAFAMVYRVDGDYTHAFSGIDNLYTLLGAIHNMAFIHELRTVGLSGLLEE